MKQDAALRDADRAETGAGRPRWDSDAATDDARAIGKHSTLHAFAMALALLISMHMKMSYFTGRHRVRSIVTIVVSGLAHYRPLAALARSRLAAALGRLSVAPVAAAIAFFDDDGSRGGAAMRCALTVHLPYRPSLRSESTATDPRQAFDDALAALERQVDRYRERDRDSRRRPKKYYVARQLLAEGGR